MEQLIRVTTTEQGLQLVSARDLHSFLEISNHFTQWFDDNRQLFVEGIDYEAFKVKLKAGPGFTTKIDYALTLDTAKEMAMMSRVEKGKQARQYFLACERALRQKSLPDFSNPAAAARAWAEQYEKQQLAETTIKELQPKADFADAIMQSEDTVSVGDMARILAYKGLGQNKMFDFLRANAILISNGSNQPYQKYIDQGWCKVVETKWRHPKEGQKIGVKTVFTQKGILKVRELIERAGYVPIAKVNASQPFSANYYSSSV